MDFKVDQYSLLMCLGEIGWELLEWNEMGDDVFPGHASTGGGFLALASEEKVGGFVRHPGRRRGAEEVHEFVGGVACLLKEFAFGAVDHRLVGEFLFIPDESGADFEDPGLDGTAELLDEDDFALRSEGEDAHDAGGIRAGGEFPVINFAKGEVASFVVGEGLGHIFTIHRKESVAKARIRG